MPTPDSPAPGSEQAAADSEALERASEQLGSASEAVAQASRDLEQAASESGTNAAATQAAREALDAAGEALGEASEQLADAASQGGGDPTAMQDAVAAAEEALAAAEEALAAAEAAAGEAAEQLADAGGPGEEEPLPAEEENPAGGSDSLAAAADSASAGGGLSGGLQNPAQGAADGLAGAEDGAPASGGQATIVVAVAGARESLEQGQAAVDGAIRALIITGIYQPGGDASLDGGQAMPGGGVLILMPGEPGENDKIAQLENELEDTLVVIDGRLLEERDKLASQRSGTGPGLPGDDQAGLEDPGAEAAALLEELGAGGIADAGEAEQEMEELPAGAVADSASDRLGAGDKDSNTRRPSDIPEGIPDGSDDDIVARQIREAAMNETDPVLREKLWREYINYKKGGG